MDTQGGGCARGTRITLPWATVLNRVAVRKRQAESLTYGVARAC